MPIYVARWDELLIPDTDPGPKGPDQKVWVPLGVGDSPFAALDLTPPGAAPWRCLFRSPIVLADVPGRRRLSEPGERLTTLIRNRLGNDLGITLEDRPSMAEILAHILFDHARDDGTRWRRLRPSRRAGRSEIWLGGLVWSMPVIQGGAITDDFNRADNADLSVGAPFSWTEVEALSPISITSNEVKCTDTGSTTGSLRAEVDMALDDHYAQAGANPSAAGNEVGSAVRFDPSANTCYIGTIRNSTSGTFRIWKNDAGTRTLLSGLNSTAQSGYHLVRTEADGSTITLLVDGVEQRVVTDTSIVNNLRTGIATAGSNATWFADDFEAGDLAAGAQTVTPGLITNTPVLFSPRIDQQVQIGLIGSSTAIFAPSVELEPQTVSPGLIENAPVLFAPTVNQNVVIGIILNSPSIHAPEVGQSVEVGLIANPTTVHAPRMDQQVQVGIVANPSTVYAPTITDDGPQTVSVGLISHGTHVYSPALTKFWVRDTGSPRNRRPGTTRIRKRSRGTDPGIDTGN